MKTLVIYDIHSIKKEQSKGWFGIPIFTEFSHYLFSVVYPDGKEENTEYAKIKRIPRKDTGAIWYEKEGDEGSRTPIHTPDLTGQQLLKRKQTLQVIINNLENLNYLVDTSALSYFMANKIESLILKKG